MRRSSWTRRRGPIQARFCFSGSSSVAARAQQLHCERLASAQAMPHNLASLALQPNFAGLSLRHASSLEAHSPRHAFGLMPWDDDFQPRLCRARAKQLDGESSNFQLTPASVANSTSGDLSTAGVGVPMHARFLGLDFWTVLRTFVFLYLAPPATRSKITA